jgi:signal transduction histidine kinase
VAPIIDMMTLKAHQKGVTLQQETHMNLTELNVWVDKIRITQIVMILIQDAIDKSQMGSSVLINALY